MEKNEVAVDDAVVVGEGCVCNIGMCVGNDGDGDGVDDDDGYNDAAG